MKAYFKYTSNIEKKEINFEYLLPVYVWVWSRNKVFLKCKQSTFFIFSGFYTSFIFLFRKFTWSFCPLFVTIFLEKIYFLVIPNELHWKEIQLTVVSSSDRLMNIHSRVSYHALLAFQNFLFWKNYYMSNRHSAHGVTFSQMK